MGKRARKIKSNPAYDRAFGNRIKELRERLGWSQVDLASHSSVSSTQISVLENGHESPQLYTVVAIAIAFGLTPSKLLEFSFPFNFNTDFTSTRKKRKTGATEAVRKLFDDNFFKEPRTVQQVVAEAKRKHRTTLMSAEVSGALLYLVGRKKLTKIRERTNRNLYQAK